MGWELGAILQQFLSPILDTSDNIMNQVAILYFVLEILSLAKSQCRVRSDHRVYNHLVSNKILEIHIYVRHSTQININNLLDMNEIK